MAANPPAPANVRAGSTHAGNLPDKPAPMATEGPLAWMRDNLFNSTSNTILSLIALALVVWVVPPVLDWTIFSANWTGGGGCLPGEPRTRPAGRSSPPRWEQFLYGFYPRAERWRVNIVLAILAVGIVLLAFERTPGGGSGSARLHAARLPPSSPSS